MSRFNKATAAAFASGLVGLVAAFIELSTETQGAVTTLITTAMVWLVPNAEA